MQNKYAGKQSKATLGLIFVIMLMDVIGITLLSPVAPNIVQKFSREALMVTMLTVLYAGGQFIAAPLIGKLGDRYGRRPVLLISLFGQGIGYLIFGIGGALWILFLGRIIGGITGGNLSTAGAYIADVSKPEQRSKNFALMSFLQLIGFIGDLNPCPGCLFRGHGGHPLEDIFLPRPEKISRHHVVVQADPFGKDILFEMNCCSHGSTTPIE